MKFNKTIFVSLILLVVVASLYRIIPGRPYGFAPQIAMAVFAGAVIKDRKWAFMLPIISMFISDVLYHFLYTSGLTDMQGFYEGQWQNYLSFALLVFIGFFIKKANVLNVLATSIAAPVIYFLISNFIVWAGWQGTRGLNRPKTWDGLMECYYDGIPFFMASIAATILFSTVLFGAYYLISRRSNVHELKAA